MQNSLRPELVGLGSQISTLNPYYNQAQAGANQVGQLGPQVAGMQQQGAAQLQGAGTSILRTAFDPQQSLYNSLFQQRSDQVNAQNAMSGVQGPYAAGVANDALDTFNIDWQNAQLQRQAQGIQSGGQAFAGASGLGTGGLSTLLSSQTAPYTTANMPVQDQISQLQGLQTIYGQQYSPLQSYLQLGQGASGLAQSGQNSSFGQNLVTGQNLATALSNPTLSSGLQQLFSSSGPYGGGSSYSGPSDPGAGLGYYSTGSDYGASGALAY